MIESVDKSIENLICSYIAPGNVVIESLQESVSSCHKVKHTLYILVVPFIGICPR
jgi:hypothetical protein